MSSVLKWATIFIGAAISIIVLYVLVGVWGFGIGLGGIWLVHIALRGFNLSGSGSSYYSKLEERQLQRKERIRRAQLESKRASKES